MRKNIFLPIVCLALLGSCSPTNVEPSPSTPSPTTSYVDSSTTSTTSVDPSTSSSTTSVDPSTSTSSTSADPSTSSSTTSIDPSTSTSSTSADPSTSVVNKYNVVFKDEDGNTLSTQQIEENVVPSYTYNVDAKDDKEWNYTFIGWGIYLGSDEVVTISGATQDITYFAIVSKVKNKYTITFEENGGSIVSDVTLDYGSVISEQPETTKSGFNFTGWTLSNLGTDKVVFPYTVVDNVTFYAQFNEKVDLKQYLPALLNGFKLDPLSYIPDALKPGYAPNIVTSSSLNVDYSSFVNIGSINQHGFGEQWQMVVDNLSQSQVFFNTLTVVETISASAITAFNNYLDSNPGTSASYNFVDGIYNVYINCDSSSISFVLEYNHDFPLVGEQKAQIALSLNIETNERTARIELGAPNALVYTVSENSYSFAIKYLGVRRAYFEIEKDENDVVTGQIYEYVGYGPAMISSCAEFIIDDTYACVVGNKADAIIGFTGYIVELYNVSTGRLLGFKKKEIITSPATIEYDTYGFDLSYYSGITSIKESPENAGKFRLNNSATDFVESLVGILGGLKAASRRFYIETSIEYFYTYEGEKVVDNKVNVPILLVQENYLSKINAEIKKDNPTLNINLSLSNAHLSKLDSVYSPMIEEFKIDKLNVNAEQIVSLIGDSYVVE